MLPSPRHRRLLLGVVVQYSRRQSFRTRPADIAHDRDEHPQLAAMRKIYDYLTPSRLQECFNDAHFHRQEVREQFKRGQLDLRTRSTAENLFLDILQRISVLLEEVEHTPADLENLKQSLADIYYGNFSLFQSLPDIWAIDQLFPIMPIHRLNEAPSRQAVLADITCDCDGKIDHFIDTREGHSPTLNCTR